MRVLPILLAIALSGCVTDDRQARLKPYMGRTMADFSRSTGLVPSDSYAIAGGKAFVVNGPALAVAVPGAIATGGCRMLIDTIAVSPRGTADDWRITEINATGPC